MGETYKGAFIEWIEQWSQFFERCNWRTFHLAHIEFEDDRMMGAVETTIVILGLGFRARWNYADTETTIELERRMAEIDEADAAAIRAGEDDG